MKSNQYYKIQNAIVQPAFAAILIIILYGMLQFFREDLFLLSNKHPLLDLFLGSFPNFVGGIIGTLIFTTILKMRMKKYLFLSFLLSGILLTFEEFLPVVFGNNYFDAKDIIASWIGSFACVICNLQFSKNNK